MDGGLSGVSCCLQRAGGAWCRRSSSAGHFSRASSHTRTSPPPPPWLYGCSHLERFLRTHHARGARRYGWLIPALPESTKGAFPFLRHYSNPEIPVMSINPSGAGHTLFSGMVRVS